MAKQTINIGTAANSRNGDPLRTAFTKVNENFTELYAAVDSIPDVSTFITAEDIPAIPADTSDLTNNAGFITADDITIPSDIGDLTDSIKLSDLKTLVAASTDFADFQSRIAAL